MKRLLVASLVLLALLPLSAAVRDISKMSDDEFIDMVERDSVNYFVKHAHPKSGLIAYDGVNTHMGTNGFALNAFVIGAERKYITREEAAKLTLKMLEFFRNTARQKYGAFLWMCDAETAGKPLPGANFDIVETGYVCSGALVAKQYFDGNSETEKNIRQYADDIYRRVEFDSFTKDSKGRKGDTLAWSFEIGKDCFSDFRISGYNECMIIYIVALGSPARAAPAKCWDGWASSYQWGYRYGQYYFFCPAMFTHQYTQCWADLRDAQDKYTKKQNITYFENSRRAALSHIEYAKANPNNFPDYGPVWGLTDCGCPLHQGGFGAHGFTDSWAGWVDDGTVAVTGSGASIMFTPKESIECLRYIYEKYGDRIYDEFGFRSAFNTKTGWVDPAHDMLNKGAFVSAIENYRSGLIWKLFMKNPEIKAAYKKAGFKKAVIREEKDSKRQYEQSDMLDKMDSAGGCDIYRDKGARAEGIETAGKTGKALQISYDLGSGAWIGFGKQAEYDLSKYSGISFDFCSDGAKNKLEIKIEDADGSVFGYSMPTGVGAAGWIHKQLPFDDFWRWWGGDDNLNLKKVKVSFAVSKQQGGAGTVIMQNLAAITKAE
jgi:hypothetical protein